MTWYDETPQGVVLRIKVQPKAAKNQISGLHGEPPRLKIRIAAPPVDGKANRALLEFLSDTLGVSSSKLEFIRGANSTHKDILCIGVSLDKINGLISEEPQLSFWKGSNVSLK